MGPSLALIFFGDARSGVRGCAAPYLNPQPMFIEESTSAKLGKMLLLLH
jgi:hypothetical protein